MKSERRKFIPISLSLTIKLFSVYIVQCSDGSYYTGLTSNVDNRIAYHNSPENIKSYTSSRKPVNLLWSLQLSDFNEAERFEKQIKGWTRKKKEALMAENWDRLKLLSICQNESKYTKGQDRKNKQSGELS